MTEAPRDPRLLRPEIPAPLAELVLRCLAKAPADRPADTAAVVRALEGTGSMTGAGALGSNGALRAGVPLVPLPTVLGTWAGGALLLVGGAYAAGKTIGVPSWAMPSAVTLAAAGLPALLGAWWVQRTAQRALTRTPTLTPGGTMAAPSTLATLALRAQPHVTVRRTRRLGVMAGSVFTVLVGGFVASRAYGIGPAASLMSAGEFGKRESVLVADFHSPATDTTLGVTVAEALRTDLAQSPNLAVLTRASVRDALQRMQRKADAPVPFDLAREIATREGTKAVIDGDVVRLGTSYVLSARLVAAVDGRELAAFRETAKDDAELVPAVGKLSRSIREKVGESLKGLGEVRALERLSTPSLAALRKFVEGARIDELGGDRARALQLLQEAVTLDTAFAMAWRKMSALYSNLPDSRTQTMATAAKAYRFRDRLTDDERDLADAQYFSYGPSPDPAKAIAAYEQLLARDSLNSTALNNLGVAYTRLRQFPKTLAVFQRAAALSRPPSTAFLQLSALAGRRQLPDVADSAAVRFARLFPGSSRKWDMTVGQLLAHRLLDSLVQLSRLGLETSQDPRFVASTSGLLRVYEWSRGRPAAGLAASHAGRVAQDRLAKRAPRPFPDVLDSVYATALYDGDKGRVHALLQRLVTPALYAATPAADRNWNAAAQSAALVGDVAGIMGIEAARRRDNTYTSGDPAWEDARFAGYVALAKGQYKEAITQLQRAGTLHTAASPQEAFLIAMAFDRAGTRDSAIAWFTRVVDPAEAGENEAFVFSAAAHKGVAELLDAKGDAAGAITHYDAFAAAWKDAEPSRQPVVKAARERAAQLRAKKDPG
jgi:tetratricopeptide (TPR) repeat protein